MKIECKFDLGQKVRHRFNEFQDHITGVVVRMSHIEYEVLPLTDSNARWVPSVWIEESYLEEEL